MRIVVINHYGSTPDAHGTTRHFDMAYALAEHFKCKAELWVCGNDRITNGVHESLKGRIVSKQNYGKVDVVRIRSTSEMKKNGLLRQINMTIFSVLSGLKVLFGKKIDICVQSVPTLGVFTAFMLKIRGTKLIIDVEDIWPLFLKDLGLKNKFVIFIQEKSANFLYNCAAGIDAVSNGMVNYVKSKLKDKNKEVFLSPLGVKVEEYMNATPIIKPNYAWNGKFTVMYTGAHGIANGLISIVKAAEILKDKKDIAFVFIGDGGAKEELIEYKNINGLDNVYFENAVHHSYVPSLLKGADVGITHLKRVESFKLVRPNKIFEYMAAAKPIICGIEGESTDIINEAECGITVESENSQQIAEAVMNLYYSKEKLQELGIRGNEYIMKYGNRDIILKEFCKRVENIAKVE